MSLFANWQILGSISRLCFVITSRTVEHGLYIFTWQFWINYNVFLINKRKLTLDFQKWDPPRLLKCFWGGYEFERQSCEASKTVLIQKLCINAMISHNLNLSVSAFQVQCRKIMASLGESKNLYISTFKISATNGILSMRSVFHKPCSSIVCCLCSRRTHSVRPTPSVRGWRPGRVIGQFPTFWILSLLLLSGMGLNV